MANSDLVHGLEAGYDSGTRLLVLNQASFKLQQGEEVMKRSAVNVILLAMVLCAAASADEYQHDRRNYIPAGTTIEVRIVESLTSEKVQVGDIFHATLTEPLVIEGREMYPKGADVAGRVTEAHASGRLSDPGVLALEITQISYNGRTTPVRVEPYTLRGESHTKSNATKIGGGAALGAVIGAIAGGGKGAAVGTVVGAGAGTGVAAASGKKDATIESEALLAFVVSADPPPAATPQASAPPPPGPPAPPPPPSAPAPEIGGGRGDLRSEPGDPAMSRFSLRDQRLIRNCFSEHGSEFAPELTSRRETQDQRLQPGQVLPPGLEKRVRPLPDVCEQRLAPLPGDLERVVYHRWVMLLDSESRVLDSFDLDK